MAESKYKKTTFVWIILVIGVIDTIGKIIGLATPFLRQQYMGYPSLLYAGIILNIIAIGIAITYIYKLYFIKLDVFKWTHIVFGYDLFIVLFGFISIFINMPLVVAKMLETNPEIGESIARMGIIISASMNLIITSVIVILIWVFFYKHLKKAKEQKLMKFNK